MKAHRFSTSPQVLTIGAQYTSHLKRQSSLFEVSMQIPNYTSQQQNLIYTNNKQKWRKMVSSKLENDRLSSLLISKNGNPNSRKLQSSRRETNEDDKRTAQAQ